MVTNISSEPEVTVSSSVALLISYDEGRGSVEKSISIRLEERKILLVGLCPTARYDAAPLLPYKFPPSRVVSWVIIG